MIGPIRVNKDSWHYKLAKLWSTGRPPTNLCPYTRAVVFSLALSLATLAFFGWLLLSPFAAAYLAWVGVPIPRPVLIGTLITVGSILLIAGLWFVENKEPAPRGSARYLAVRRAKAWKDKVCPRIVFTEE